MKFFTLIFTLLFCISIVTCAPNLIKSFASSSSSSNQPVGPLPFNVSLSGVWIKHDRAVEEKFHINIECTACCDSKHNNEPSNDCLTSYTAYYIDGPLAEQNTFNITVVGDGLSAIGTYNNFADNGNIACQPPFALVFTQDDNIVLVSYASSIHSQCGGPENFYAGDSAIYYRQSAMVWADNKLHSQQFLLKN